MQRPRFYYDVPTELAAAIQQQDVKDELRTRTDEAHALGVPGVPTLVVDGEVFYGDDHLDEAAARVAART